MYQPCTSTAVNHGEQRGVAVTRKRVVSRPNALYQVRPKLSDLGS